MRILDVLAKGLETVFDGIVAPVPCQNQACESCRVTQCTAEQMRVCLDRRCGEAQERARRAGGLLNELDAEFGDIPVSSRWRATHPVQVSGIEHSMSSPLASEASATSSPDVSHLRASEIPPSVRPRESIPPSTRRRREG